MLYIFVGTTLHLPEQVIELNSSQQARLSSGRKLPSEPRREVNSETFGNLSPVRAAPSDYSAKLWEAWMYRANNKNDLLCVSLLPLFIQEALVLCLAPLIRLLNSYLPRTFNFSHWQKSLTVHVLTESLQL